MHVLIDLDCSKVGLIFYTSSFIEESFFIVTVQLGTSLPFNLSFFRQGWFLFWLFSIWELQWQEGPKYWVAQSCDNWLLLYLPPRLVRPKFVATVWLARSTAAGTITAAILRQRFLWNRRFQLHLLESLSAIKASWLRQTSNSLRPFERHELENQATRISTKLWRFDCLLRK